MPLLKNAVNSMPQKPKQKKPTKKKAPKKSTQNKPVTGSYY